MASRRLLAIAALALLAPALYVREPARRDTPAGPRVLLWAWERPDDLRGLPPGVGVAFLVQTITVAGGSHVVARRRQALQVDEGTPMMAVTRIEAPGDAGRADLPAIARAIAETGRLPMISGIQIDFDARPAQRFMYRTLLHDVHTALPPRVPLAITALASWCLDDNWLDELPVDEAVPMLFRVGPGTEALHRDWDTQLTARQCRGTLGVSIDEPLPRPRKGQRLYIFNPRPWTAATVQAALEGIR